jgi:hypothetical protein
MSFERRFWCIPMAKYVVPSYHRKHHLVFFLMVLHAVILGGWFIVGDHFFFFFSAFLSLPAKVRIRSLFVCFSILILMFFYRLF